MRFACCITALASQPADGILHLLSKTIFKTGVSHPKNRPPELPKRLSDKNPAQGTSSNRWWTITGVKYALLFPVKCVCGAACRGVGSWGSGGPHMAKQHRECHWGFEGSHLQLLQWGAKRRCAPPIQKRSAGRVTSAVTGPHTPVPNAAGGLGGTPRTPATPPAPMHPRKPGEEGLRQETAVGRGGCGSVGRVRAASQLPSLRSHLLAVLLVPLKPPRWAGRLLEGPRGHREPGTLPPAAS